MQIEAFDFAVVVSGDSLLIETELSDVRKCLLYSRIFNCFPQVNILRLHILEFNLMVDKWQMGGRVLLGCLYVAIL